MEIRAYDFGGLDGIAALDPDLKSASGTYDKLIEELQKAGYQAGEDLYGAPYDFRLAADGLEQVRDTPAVDLVGGCCCGFLLSAVCCSASACQPTMLC